MESAEHNRKLEEKKEATRIKRIKASQKREEKNAERLAAYHAKKTVRLRKRETDFRSNLSNLRASKSGRGHTEPTARKLQTKNVTFHNDERLAIPPIPVPPEILSKSAKKSHAGGEQCVSTRVLIEEENEKRPMVHTTLRCGGTVRVGRTKSTPKRSIKKISDMTPQQQRVIREKNREYKRNERARKSGGLVNIKNGSKNVSSTIRATRSRELKLRRKIAALLNKLAKQRNLMNKWKTRYFRLKRTTDDTDTLTPRKIVKKTIQEGPAEVKKRLLYCESFMHQLALRKTQMRTEREKSVFAQVLSGKILKKYRLMRQASSLISPYIQRKHFATKAINLRRCRNKKVVLHSTLANSVAQFFEKDENSANAPAAKDCITRHGKSFRKRFLLDTMDNLYKKYCTESAIQMSRSTFYRLKPFYVVKHVASSRDTCFCKAHANIDFLLQKLESLKILPSKSTREFTTSMCCDPYRKQCMYRECDSCINNAILVPDDSNSSWYYQWQTTQVDRLGAKGLTYHVKIMSKTKVTCTVSEIVTELNSRTLLYLRHVYDTGHQYKAFEKIRNDLRQNEMMIAIDFSENYGCKYASEIQSVHFGASKKQVSLHSGAFFYKEESTGTIKCFSFGTVSECLRHDASSIWAHLKPIIDVMKSVAPELDTIHFQSDGPSTQYKNKTNFYLFLHYCQELGLKTATWNFPTPGHGKSCADASGGTVKSTCDRAVARGIDITCAEDMITVVSSQEEAKIKMFLVLEEDVQKVDPLIPQGLKTVPKTQQVFQLVWKNDNHDTLYMNYLSCTACMLCPPCKHFHLSPSSFKFSLAKVTPKQPLPTIPLENLLPHPIRISRKSSRLNLKSKKEISKEQSHKAKRPKTNSKRK